MRFAKVLFFTGLLALVVVPVAFALRFTDESFHPPTGVTGQAYGWSFTGAGGCGPALPYQYRVLAGSPPPGLTLDTSGLVHGIPTQAGDYSFWVELSDENPPSASWCRPESAQREFTFHIVTGLNIVQRQSSLGAIAVNAPYSLQLTANGGGSLTWSVVSGALPAGINLNASSGLLSGTPTAKGDFSFKIQVTDGSRTDAQTYTLSVLDPMKLSVSPVPGAEVGLPFELKPTISGGKPGYTFSITGGTLPEGLNLDPATGTISGKPTTPGTYPVKLTAKDTIGLTQTVDVNLVVATKLLFTKQPLKAAKVGKRYIARLVASGGARPFKWVLLGGRPGILPPGIKLNARTGVLSGTPRKAGLYRLRFQVTDRFGIKSSAGLVLKVTA